MSLVPYIIILLNVFGQIQAYFETCDTAVNISAGQTLSIQSPGYASGYGYVGNKLGFLLKFVAFYIGDFCFENFRPQDRLVAIRF